MNANERRTRHA